MPLERIQELKQAVKALTDSSAVLQMVDFPVQEGFAKRSLNGRKVNMTELCEQLQGEMGKVIAQLKSEFQDPLPEDQTGRYRRREEAVGRALDLIEDSLVLMYGEWGISEVEVREMFSYVKPEIRHVVLVIGE